MRLRALGRYRDGDRYRLEADDYVDVSDEEGGRLQRDSPGTFEVVEVVPAVVPEAPVVEPPTQEEIDARNAARTEAVARAASEFDEDEAEGEAPLPAPRRRRGIRRNST